MLIDSSKVHEMCQIQSNPNTLATLMAAFPKQAAGGNVYVGKQSINLPADIDTTPGSFYIMRVVDISRNVRNPPVLGEYVAMVEADGELVKSSFCRIDYTYRAVYRTRLASDIVQGHREADAILSWEESMPPEVRLEYLYYTLKNPSFDAFKWKVSTRDIIDGQDANQVANLQNVWNQLAARQGKSEMLVSWLGEHPLVTPNTNNTYRMKSSFQQQEPQRIPPQVDYNQMHVRKYPNGFPRRSRGYQNVQQTPAVPQSVMPQQQAPCIQPPMTPMQMCMQPAGWPQPMMQNVPQMVCPSMGWPQPMVYPQNGMSFQQQVPPQYGWQQQPPMNPYMQAYTSQQPVINGYNVPSEQKPSNKL